MTMNNKTFVVEVPVRFTTTYAVRMDREDVPVEVERVLDFSELTGEGLMALAMKSIIIDCQAADRRNATKKGSDGTIPVKATVVVKNPGTRAATPESVEKKLERLLGKDKAGKLLDKFEGDAVKALSAIEALLA